MAAADGRLEFMLDAVGPGTSELCEIKPGDELLVLGPFGRGFRPVKESRAFICAGGIGVAPMVGLQVALGPEAKVLLDGVLRRYVEAVVFQTQAVVVVAAVLIALALIGPRWSPVAYLFAILPARPAELEPSKPVRFAQWMALVMLAVLDQTVLSPILKEQRERSYAMNINTCHMWDENGAMVSDIRAGQPVEIPLPVQRRLRSMGLPENRWLDFDEE